MRKPVFLLVLALLWGLPAGAESFPRPGSVETRVGFWTRVYTEIGTDAGFLHDSQHLDIVYDTIRFSQRASWRSQQRTIRREKDRVRAILRRLGNGKRTGLDREEQRILSLWPEGVSNATLARAARRVRFQLGQANKFRAGLQRASTWEPHIREVIAAQQVPAELSALPHVESSYEPGAVSKVGAAGMWQFTRSTGRRYLRVDHVVDERFDPYRSSEAAAQLLRENYEKTDSWPLAITAYNHGINGMRRAARQLGTKDIGVIIERYRSRTFGFASQNFYSEFLAALHVDLNGERYFGRLEPVLPEEPETIRLDHYYPATALSQAFGVPAKELRRLNPALRGPVWNGQKHVPKGFELRLPPASERPPATTLLTSIPQEHRFAKQRPDLYYRVRRGDSLSTIARRYGVRQSDIVALNGIRNKHRIRAGQRLRIPESRKLRHAARVAKREPREPRKLAADGTYTVRRGDTLTAIARDLGATPEELVMANALLRPDHLEIGQLLRPAAVRADADEVDEATEAEAAGTTAPAAAEPPVVLAQARSLEEAPATAPEPVAEEEAATAPEPVAEEAPATAPEAVAEQEPVAEAPIAEEAEEEAQPEPASELASLPFGPPAPEAAEGVPADGPEPNPDYALPDRERYATGPDGALRVQPEETLGHYAHWLDLPTSRLRRLNGIRYGTPVVIGQRLRLDFSRVPREDFEARRIAHHQTLRTDFFRNHRIAGTAEHVLRRGETLWELSRRRYRVPVWLLSDFNRDVDFASLQVGVRLTIPRVERVAPQAAHETLGHSERAAS